MSNHTHSCSVCDNDYSECLKEPWDHSIYDKFFCKNCQSGINAASHGLKLIIYALITRIKALEDFREKLR